MAFSCSSRVRLSGENMVCVNKPHLNGHRVVYKWGDGYQTQKKLPCRCKWNFQQVKTLSHKWARLLDSDCGHTPEKKVSFQHLNALLRESTRFSDSISATILSTVATEAKGKADFLRGLKQCTSVKHTVFLVALTALLVIPSANAVDALKTCACLLKECRLELAKCISNPSCAANVACLQTCNNRPDETECQIKCGDLFENGVVDEFNECAVSRKKCVPRKSDAGEFAIPDPAVLVSSFNLDNFTGKWYITSGLNPSFDTFDCQLHEFQIESGRLVGNLSWRIRTPDTGFITRTAVQKFVQDPKYILSSKLDNEPDDYVFVYYRGSNDAWDGYGGAVVYTRSPVLPESIIPELEKAAKNVSRDFGKFKRTDNSCGPEPLLGERLEKTVEEGEEIIAKEVEEIREEIEEEVSKVASTEVTLFQRLYAGFQELLKDGNYFLKELNQEEMEILKDLKMEASEIEGLFSRALPIRKLR